VSKQANACTILNVTVYVYLPLGLPCIIVTLLHYICIELKELLTYLITYVNPKNNVSINVFLKHLRNSGLKVQNS